LRIVDDAADLSPAHRAMIRRESAKLSGFYGRILEIRVVVTVPNRRLHREVMAYEVRVHLAVPRGEIVVRRCQHTNLLTAVQNAFAAARRRLQDFTRRERPPLGARATSLSGRVTHLFPFEGYGFIEGAEADVYFHRRSVLAGRFADLEVGDRVRYSVEVGRKGPQASTVAPSGAGRARRPVAG
jgi:cold shock CspA family protein/ribosome-associated translation inhibitor RaiA